MTDAPATIDNRWDILYRDYPEIYNAFAAFPYDPRWVDVVNRDFPLAGKSVVDVGSGTGKSSFSLAEYAAHVLGVEPEAAMRDVAERAAAQRQVDNVTFLEGHAAALVVPDASVDMVTAITARIDVPEALRVLRPGGLMLQLDIATDWYGGELNQVISHPTPDLTERNRRLVEELGFSRIVFDSVQEYGSTENIVRTYGFIFGYNAIDHLRRTGQTAIRWKFHIHSRSKELPVPSCSRKCLFALHQQRGEHIPRAVEPALDEDLAPLELAVLVLDADHELVAGGRERGHDVVPAHLAQTGLTEDRPAEATAQHPILVERLAGKLHVPGVDMEDALAALRDRADDLEHLPADGRGEATLLPPGQVSRQCMEMPWKHDTAQCGVGRTLSKRGLQTIRAGQTVAGQPCGWISKWVRTKRA